jgi:hypothetical protein
MAMRDRLLLGVGRTMLPIPALLWRRMVAGNARTTPARLGFMTADHHRVRDFVVMELPRAGAPIAPERIAETLGMPLARVRTILEDLERHLTFLFRGDGHAVTWAYPVTVDTTPHHAVFATGEEAYSP